MRLEEGVIDLPEVKAIRAVVARQPCGQPKFLSSRPFISVSCRSIVSTSGHVSVGSSKGAPWEIN